MAAPKTSQATLPTTVVSAHIGSDDSGKPNLYAGTVVRSVFSGGSRVPTVANTNTEGFDPADEAVFPAFGTVWGQVQAGSVGEYPVEPTGVAVGQFLTVRSDDIYRGQITFSPTGHPRRTMARSAYVHGADLYTMSTKTDGGVARAVATICDPAALLLEGMYACANNPKAPEVQREEMALLADLPLPASATSQECVDILERLLGWIDEEINAPHRQTTRAADTRKFEKRQRSPVIATEPRPSYLAHIRAEGSLPMTTMEGTVVPEQLNFFSRIAQMARDRRDELVGTAMIDHGHIVAVR
jgi:hypothetical protein